MDTKHYSGLTEDVRIIISQFLIQIEDKDTYICQLEERIKYLNSVIFGSKSEKYLPGPKEEQYTLFNEAEKTHDEEPKIEESLSLPVHARKKPGRKPLPAEFPRLDVVCDLPDAEKTCACGVALTRIGEEVSEKLDILPAALLSMSVMLAEPRITANRKVQVIRTIRYKYACRGCEGVESEGGAVKLAALPPQIIPKGIATAGLAAFVLTAKFVDAAPFYRQEAQFLRMGVELTRATMCNWALHVGRTIEPLIELLRDEIRSGPIINMDETTVQVLNEPGRENTTKSYMWIARGGPPEKPAVLFHYAPSRSGDSF